MQKRVIITHRWEGSPDSDWIPWAKQEFENRGYKVIAPLMPDADRPKIASWVEKLKKAVGEVRENDIFIGHSIGCQTILRFLESLPLNKKVGKVIMLTPWVKLINLSGDTEWRIAGPWLETPIDFEKVKTKVKFFVAIFSDNDKWVPLEENRKFFEEKLSPQIIVEHAKGHLTQDDGIKELPVLLKLV